MSNRVQCIVISLKEEFYNKVDALVGIYPEVRGTGMNDKISSHWFLQPLIQFLRQKCDRKSHVLRLLVVASMSTADWRASCKTLELCSLLQRLKLSPRSCATVHNVWTAIPTQNIAQAIERHIFFIYSYDRLGSIARVGLRLRQHYIYAWIVHYYRNRFQDPNFSLFW